MKSLKVRYTIFMHKHFKRYRLRKICKALDIVPYPWQRDFALGKTDTLNAPEGRATGKTMAVMLRLLMAYPGKPVNALHTLLADPDFRTASLRMLYWYDSEYRRCTHACDRARIPVYHLNIRALYK